MKELTDKVLFLDLDGPLFPDPVIKKQAGSRFEDDFLQWFSDKHLKYPIPLDYIYMCENCVDHVNLLAREYDFKTVISSSWYEFFYDRSAFDTLFSINGLKVNFHEDWHTPRKMRSNRLQEIHWWLQDHPGCDWIAIDDMFSGSCLTDHYTLTKMEMEPERVIIVDTEIGFTHDHVKHVRKKIWK